MSFDWKNFIEIAEYLLTNPSQKNAEAFYRTAVSRAYYAAYHCTRRYAETKLKYIPSESNQHRDLRSFLKGVREIKLSDHLDKLHKLRVQCDYDKTVRDLSADMVASAINKTKNLLSLLN